MFGQVGFFYKFAGKEIEDKRPLNRYRDESKRLLGVMETRLDGRQWIMGDLYTIADISMLGWVRNLVGFYGARDLVEFDSFPNVAAWLERGLARPAVQRGLNIPARAESYGSRSRWNWRAPSSGLQPMLTPPDPQFVLRREIGRRVVERADLDLDLVVADRKQPRAAVRTEAPAFPGSRFAGKGERSARPDGENHHHAAGLLPAQRAMAYADARRIAFDRIADLAALHPPARVAFVIALRFCG